jgi:hypothetical protein
MQETSAGNLARLHEFAEAGSVWPHGRPHIVRREQVAAWAAGARVVKIFNTTFAFRLMRR